MEIKSLILGVIFTLGIFAIKSGIGLYYVLMSKIKKRNFIFILTIISYFFLFLSTFLIVKHLNILEFFGIFEKILKTGMIVHIILAIGMIWWGIHILGEISENTKGYLMLIFPCPFCFIVVFLCSSFLYKYFGECNFKITLLFFLCFIITQFITFIVLYFLKKFINLRNINNILGYSLVTIGCYFIITFCFAPVFSEINRIFRISSYSATKFTFSKHTLIFLIISLTIIISGFLRRKVK